MGVKLASKRSWQLFGCLDPRKSGLCISQLCSSVKLLSPSLTLAIVLVPWWALKTYAYPQVLPTARGKAGNYIPLTWVTGTVQEYELSKQPGEVSQGPANLFTFLSTRKEKVGWSLTDEKDIICWKATTTLRYTENCPSSALSIISWPRFQSFCNSRVNINYCTWE